MEQRGRLGYGLVFVGVGLQVAGLSWDALLHHLDPDLARNEGVFSLTNPSHLLVVLGLGLTAFGAIWGLLVGAGRRPSGPLLPAGPVLASAALVVLLGTMAGIGLTTGGLSGTHDHGRSHREQAETEALAGDPTFESLKQIVRESGTEAALAQLERLAAADAGVLARGHALAHALGRFSYAYYDDVNAAFSRCRQVFESGCYHGVLEGHLQTKPELEGDDVASLCTTAIDTSSSQFAKFQCVHGLGHGLTMYFDHDIFVALEHCDLLPTDWERSSCYGGVFMENIVSATHPGHVASGHHEPFLKADDLLYPCNAVEERYQAACYGLQTSAILWFNGSDFAAAFETCGTAPEQFVGICYQSMGRDISGFTLRDAGRSLELCRLGAEDYRSHCYAAVAKQFIDVAGETEQAVSFCRLVEEDGKASCYQAIGEMVATLYSDAESKRRECAKAEEAYVEACAAGAQL